MEDESTQTEPGVRVRAPIARLHRSPYSAAQYGPAVPSGIVMADSAPYSKSRHSILGWARRYLRSSVDHVLDNRVISLGRRPPPYRANTNRDVPRAYGPNHVSILSFASTVLVGCRSPLHTE